MLEGAYVHTCMCTYVGVHMCMEGKGGFRYVTSSICTKHVHNLQGGRRQGAHTTHVASALLPLTPSPTSCGVCEV